MTHAQTPMTAPTPSPDVVVRHLPDGAVLVDLRTNAIFELNATGSRIWALLAEGTPPDAIAAALSAEYAVDAAEATREVSNLFARLAEAGLVRP